MSDEIEILRHQVAVLQRNLDRAREDHDKERRNLLDRLRAGADEVRESNRQIADAYAALSMFDTGSGASVADLINELRKMWQEAEAGRKQIP